MSRLHEAFNHTARNAVLTSLPVLATFFNSCGDGSGHEVPTPLPAQTKSENSKLTRESIIEKARAKNMGVVFVSIENYESGFDLDLQFERVDNKGESEDEDIDLQVQNVNSTLGGPNLEPINTVFLASSCTGEYKISISFDKGNTYKTVGNMGKDGQLHDTFKLNANCIEELYITTPK